MEIELLGAAGPLGWPQRGCRCASCARLRTAGVVHPPLRLLIDGLPPERHVLRQVPGGVDVRTPAGGRMLITAEPGGRPEPDPGVAYDAVLLDPAGAPEHLGLLRRVGAVTPATRVLAGHLDHRLPGPAELERRARWWPDPPAAPHRTLVLGGTRSGKSAEAELRLLACPDVTYVATGTVPDGSDPDWHARVTAHRDRRPEWWRTLETTALTEVLGGAAGTTLLIDGLGGWLAAVLDDTGGWDDPAPARARIDELVEAWRRTPAHVVAVSDEVGLSLLAQTAAGRRFQDLLGDLNRRLAAESEEAVLVVAGRVMELP